MDAREGEERRFYFNRGDMAFAIHFHVTFLKDSVDKLGLQFALILASLAVYVMETDGKKSGSKPRPPKRGGSKKRN